MTATASTANAATENDYNATAEGYEDPPQAGGGLYLNLRKKGDKARIRIASRPYKFEESFTDKITGKKKMEPKWGWVVIHKEIIDDKPQKTIKAFKAGKMVYGLIFDKANDPEWGNPMHYDLTIERTEETNNFYKLTPMRMPFGPISEDEKVLIAAANLNLAELYKPKDEAFFANGEGTEDADPFANDN